MPNSSGPGALPHVQESRGDGFRLAGDHLAAVMPAGAELFPAGGVAGPPRGERLPPPRREVLVGSAPAPPHPANPPPSPATPHPPPPRTGPTPEPPRGRPRPGG